MTVTTTTPPDLTFTPTQQEQLRASALRFAKEQRAALHVARRFTRRERADLHGAALSLGGGVHMAIWPCDDGDEGAAFLSPLAGDAVAQVGWTGTAWTLIDARGEHVITRISTHAIAEAVQRHTRRLWQVRALAASPTYLWADDCQAEDDAQ